MVEQATENRRVPSSNLGPGIIAHQALGAIDALSDTCDLALSADALVLNAKHFDTLYSLLTEGEWKVRSGFIWVITGYLEFTFHAHKFTHPQNTTQPLIPAEQPTQSSA